MKLQILSVWNFPEESVLLEMYEEKVIHKYHCNTIAMRHLSGLLSKSSGAEFHCWLLCWVACLSLWRRFKVLIFHYLRKTQTPGICLKFGPMPGDLGLELAVAVTVYTSPCTVLWVPSLGSKKHTQTPLWFNRDWNSLSGSQMSFWVGWLPSSLSGSFGVVNKAFDVVTCSI